MRANITKTVVRQVSSCGHASIWLHQLLHQRFGWVEMLAPSWGCHTCTELCCYYWLRLQTPAPSSPVFLWCLCARQAQVNTWCARRPNLKLEVFHLPVSHLQQRYCYGFAQSGSLERYLYGWPQMQDHHQFDCHPWSCGQGKFIQGTLHLPWHCVSWIDCPQDGNIDHQRTHQAWIHLLIPQGCTPWLEEICLCCLPYTLN